MPTPRIVLLTGGRQIGKTTALSEAVKQLQDAGVKVAGLLTQRTGPHDLTVIELYTGARYSLTDPYRDIPGAPTPNFVMNEAAFARSTAALATSFPTQVFVLDEIGPLELRHHRGWVSVLDLLKRESYAVAFIVVRPELLGDAVVELPDAEYTVIRVDVDSRQGLGSYLFDAATARLSDASLASPGCGR